MSKGISYHERNSIVGLGFSDSDWGGCLETIKSTEGYVFLYGGGIVSWRSHKQSIVATSSCEAEYVAAYSAAKESIWLSNVISEMKGNDSTQPLTVLIDNQGAIALSKRATTSSKSKHI